MARGMREGGGSHMPRKGGRGTGLPGTGGESIGGSSGVVKTNDMTGSGAVKYSGNHEVYERTHEPHSDVIAGGGANFWKAHGDKSSVNDHCDGTASCDPTENEWEGHAGKEPANEY